MTSSLNDISGQLSWLCDAMIPGDPALGMPSASEAGVPQKLLALALLAREDLAPSFHEIVSTLPAERPLDPLAAVNAIPILDLDVIGRFVAGAYFTNQDVAAALKFPGFQALPQDPDYDEIMEIIEPIIARGPIYVEV